MNTSTLYSEYQCSLQKIADIKYASAVLEWDRETYLPKNSHDARGRQIATLNELAHQQFTDPKLEGLILQLLKEDVLSDKEKRNVRLSSEDLEKSKKLPSAFVRRLSEAVNKSFHAWIQARRKNDFSIFSSPLQDIIDLKKEEADLLGYAKHPYDALMNDYDKGLTVAIADSLFAELRPQLSTILNQIAGAPQPDDSFLHQPFDRDKQWATGLEILKRMGFDFDAGRQDISEHPFTTSFGSTDVRVTTRVDDNDFSNMLWSCIHEGGHALYEQGLPPEEYGMPLGDYCSLSIHESQSRIWENCIGRGAAFWKYHYPLLQEHFPVQLDNISHNAFYKAINKVQPSLIRTEADELTYHFHVMIRYEIEKLLIEGMIDAKDVPSYWNEKYKSYLGVTVPDDLQGCLQDVHWSHGSFGYFATYSIGSLYAAQLFSAMEKTVPGMIEGLSSGNNGSVKEWLRQNIYLHGRYYSSEALCTRATGEPLNARFFIDHVTDKYSGIYKF